jgi:26S proteasome regulatory subunit N1
MTYSDTGKRDTLHFRIISQSTEPPGLWGHEYVRHLAAELGEEWGSYYASLVETDDKDDKEEGRRYDGDQLRSLALELVGFFLQHNAEADAVDILLELEYIQAIKDKTDEKSFERVCRYMVRWVNPFWDVR